MSNGCCFGELLLLLSVDELLLLQFFQRHKPVSHNLAAILDVVNIIDPNNIVIAIVDVDTL